MCCTPTWCVARGRRQASSIMGNTPGCDAPPPSSLRGSAGAGWVAVWVHAHEQPCDAGNERMGRAQLQAVLVVHKVDVGPGDALASVFLLLSLRPSGVEGQL